MAGILPGTAYFKQILAFQRNFEFVLSRIETGNYCSCHSVENNLNESNTNQRAYHEYQILKTLPAASGKQTEKQRQFFVCESCNKVSICHYLVWSIWLAVLRPSDIPPKTRPTILLCQQFKKKKKRQWCLNNQIPRRFRDSDRAKIMIFN